MSQIYKRETAGQQPPQVATSYTADDNNTAIPKSNNLFVTSGNASDEDNEKGIEPHNRKEKNEYNRNHFRSINFGERYYEHCF